MPALPKCRSLAQSLGSWGLKFCLPEDLLGQRRPNSHLKQRFSYPVYDKTHLRGFYKTNTGPHPYGLVLWIWGPDERGTIRNKSLTLKPRQAQNSCLLLSSASWMLGWQAWVSNLHKLRRLLWTLHTQMRSLLRLKQSLLPPNKTATQRRGKQKEGKSYFASYVFTWSATPSPPPHHLFIGHSCLMNLFYEPIISIIISTETANFIQDSLPNVWLANINSEPCQQLRKVATVMNNLLINVNTEV